jgi:glutathione S-transferase
MLLYVDSQFASPYAMSVYVALREKRLVFTTQVLDLTAKQNNGPEFATISLTQRVPTLVDGDFSLSESSAITEYLEESFPGQRLYPLEVRERAQARQVQAWLRSDLAALRHERPTEVVFYGAAKAPLSVAGQTGAEKLVAVATQLLSHGGAHLFSSWCIADVDLAVALNRLVLHGDPVPDSLARYAASVWTRPSVKEWVNINRPPL